MAFERPPTPREQLTALENERRETLAMLGIARIDKEDDRIAALESNLERIESDIAAIRNRLSAA